MVRVWSREEQVANRERFWSMVGGGVSVTAACEDLGVNRRTGRRWILKTKGRTPVKRSELSRRYLSVEERFRIADLVMADESIRSIARHLGRAPSTISRELRRNKGNGRYGPHTAQRRANRRRCRLKSFKLDHRELRDVAQSKLLLKWSPEQISLHLAERFGDRPEMNVAFETIYSALYRENPLPAGWHVHLRTRRRIRKPRGLVGQRLPRICHMTMIDQRAAVVNDPKQAGHWEGDLIVGSNCRSAIATPRGTHQPVLGDGPAARRLQGPSSSDCHRRSPLSTADQGNQNPDVGSRNRARAAPRDRRSVGDQHLVL